MKTVTPKCYSWQLFYYYNKQYILFSLIFIFILFAFVKFAFVNQESDENRPIIDIRNSQKANMYAESGETNDHIKQVEIIITFTSAARNSNLRNRFQKCVESIIKYSSVPLNFNIIGDEESRELAEGMLRKLNDTYSLQYKFIPHSVEDIVRNVTPLVEKMQHHFSYKPGSYYNNPLFFLSPAIYLSLPYEKVIMLDSDLIFKSDILQLYELFDEFSPSQVIGIAHEQQPVYRHTFYQYRNRNPGTKVGDPPPNGLTGFNSGVMLLKLRKMAQSKLYLGLLEVDKIGALCDKFGFKGHLGDQDFYTLLEMEHDELFYILPCTWNRQLCEWWRKGYADVFDLYHDCSGDINVWHGNCNTPIPVQP